MIIVIMGVSGVGKTTIGKLLAEKLGWEFIEADDYHSEANIHKMRQGIPLNDEDRLPWLGKLNLQLKSLDSKSKNIVLACSALKERYRILLSNELREIQFVLLVASLEAIKKRLNKRKGHFMNPSLLESQFKALEYSEQIFQVDATLPPSTVVELIIKDKVLTAI